MKKLSMLPFFADLTAENIALLQNRTVNKKYTKGSMVFQEGQETDGLYILVSGQVRVYALHSDGREKTLDILSEGDVLGEMTLFGSEFRSASVEAMSDACFVVIPKAEFQSLIIDIPSLAIKIIEVLSRRLRQANHQIQELAFYTARNRVIYNLLRLAERHGQEGESGIKLNIRLTHAELAKLAGVSRETVSKVLRKLQDGRQIGITQRHLVILNKEELADLL